MGDFGRSIDEEGALMLDEKTIADFLQRACQYAHDSDDPCWCYEFRAFGSKPEESSNG